MNETEYELAMPDLNDGDWRNVMKTATDDDLDAVIKRAQRERERRASRAQERQAIEDADRAERIANTPHPHDVARQVADDVIAKGGTTEDSLAAAFRAIVKAANDGDPRAIAKEPRMDDQGRWRMPGGDAD